MAAAAGLRAARSGLWASAGRHAVLPLGARALTGLSAVEAPRYTRVPTPKAGAAAPELPELALSGPRPGRATGAPNPFAGLPLDAGAATPAASSAHAGTASASSAPETRFAELPCGTRIVGVDRQGLCSSLGLFVHTGSRYEPPGRAWLPHALELMAFRSSAHLSHLRTLKTLEQLGAAASCRVGREDILYQVDVLREYVPVALPLMLGNVLCPSLLPEEVAEARESVADVQRSLEENTEGLLAELLHVAAYGGEGLGSPLYANEEDSKAFTAEALREFLARECTPERLIVVGVNVDFEQLCHWTAWSFADFQPPATSSGSERVVAPAVYTGGEQRVAVANPLCHMMFGWEVPGGWNGELLAAVTVLQMFLGGGGSFSTGGPGKGMHTRMYTEVLNRHHWVESCQASSVMYADSGLFTVYATVVPQHAGAFVNVLARIFKGVKHISQQELRRAKNALKSSIHMNLEMRGVMMEDVGRQLVLSGKVGTAQEFGAMVDAVTAEDLQRALRLCLRSKPTLLAYGAIDEVPTLERIAETLGSALP